MALKNSIRFQLSKKEKENIIKEHNQFISEQTKRETSIISRAFADFALGITKTDAENKIKEHLESALEKPRSAGLRTGLPIPAEEWVFCMDSPIKLPLEPPYSGGSGTMREVELDGEDLHAVYSESHSGTGELALGVAVGNWGTQFKVPGIENWLLGDSNSTQAWIVQIFGARDVDSSGGYIEVKAPISIPPGALFLRPASGIFGVVGLLGKVYLEAHAVSSGKWFYSGKKFLYKWGRAQNDIGLYPTINGYFKTEICPSLFIHVNQSDNLVLYITVSVVAMVVGNVTPPIDEPGMKAKGLACFDASSMPEDPYDPDTWKNDYLFGRSLFDSYTESIKIPKINLIYTNCKPW